MELSFKYVSDASDNIDTNDTIVDMQKEFRSIKWMWLMIPDNSMRNYLVHIEISWLVIADFGVMSCWDLYWNSREDTAFLSSEKKKKVEKQEF